MGGDATPDPGARWRLSIDAKAIAAAHFGIEGTATQLPGYHDENYRIDTASGDRYVLKLADADPERLRLQSDVLDAIREHTPYDAPRVEGTVVLDDGCTASLLTWVDGTSFTDAGRPAASAARIGVATARIVESLAGLDGAGGGEWDPVNSVSTIRSRANAIGNQRRRALVLDVAELVEAIDLESLPKQVIHGDLNDDNILLTCGDLSGVIDAGDSVGSIRIAEPAIAAAYVAQDQEDPLTVAGRLIEGFASVADVTEDEAAHLWVLIVARLAVSVVMSASGPRDNPHRLKSEDLAWDLLERLAAGDADAMRAELSTAAGHPEPVAASQLIKQREQRMAPSLSLAYAEPINVVRGSGVYLFDERGRRYLDCVNNVAHVGHSRAEVVDAIARQAGVLNTNTRYLHEEVLRYANRLTALMPDGLEVVFLVNSGSEANELAIRLVRAATGNHDLACLDGGYHGNTTTLIEVSPYKFDGPGGAGRRPWVHIVPSHGDLPPLAGFIAESIQGPAGQVVPAPGVLATAYEQARSRGGLVIADEVQTGFGRVGSHWWAFEVHGVTPDVVTLGKPIGNGHPVGAVVTSRAVADALDMEYFNTFGGNPVSAAAANAVLDVIEGNGLRENAEAVGGYLADELRALATRHGAITDVRGAGLFLGVEITDAELAGAVVEHAKANGVLLGTDGPRHNVLKIKPPLVFTDAHADRLVAAIDEALIRATGV